MTAPEIARVLKRYELGKVHSIRELRAGDPGAPKAIIESARGALLLKRRARACDDPYLVAFQHGLQLWLESGGYPVAPLLGTREENNSMVQEDGRVYELFKYVHASPADDTPEHARLAGEALARLHERSAGYQSGWSAPEDRSTSLERVQRRIARLESVRPDLQRVCARLGALGAWAHHAIERLGRDRSASWVIHGDWHPGNTLVRAGRVVGVIDFDAARRGDPLSDLAQGLVQFSLRKGGSDPDAWPDTPDLRRVSGMFAGYASVRAPGPGAEAAIPLLMLESLVKEAVGGIDPSGGAGRREAGAFLTAIARKGEWLQEHAGELSRSLAQRGEAGGSSGDGAPPGR
jgi:Ser/Thr protein kinase RdoA (MazF antagonist)